MWTDVNLFGMDGGLVGTEINVSCLCWKAVRLEMQKCQLGMREKCLDTNSIEADWKIWTFWQVEKMSFWINKLEMSVLMFWWNLEMVLVGFMTRRVEKFLDF